MSDLVQRFTIAEMVQAAKDSGNGPRQTNNWRWQLNTTFEETCDKALSGSLETAAEATRLVDNIDTNVGAECRLRPERVVAGGTRVNVPAYLSDSPACMVRRTRQPTSTRHVNVFVGICAQANIGPKECLARGCTILGLLEALQRSQIGVKLSLYTELGTPKYRNYIQVIEVDSTPLDLSTSAYAIAHVAFSRMVCFAEGETKGFDGSWAYDRLGARYNDQLREWLGASPTDIIVSSSHINEVSGNPKNWIEKQFHQIVKEA